MSKQKYTKVQALLPVIEQMIEAGVNHRRIEEDLGLEGDRPVHNFLKRQRVRQLKAYPSSVVVCLLRLYKKYKYENRRVEMELADRENNDNPQICSEL